MVNLSLVWDDFTDEEKDFILRAVRHASNLIDFPNMVHLHMGLLPFVKINVVAGAIVFYDGQFPKESDMGLSLLKKLNQSRYEWGDKCPK